MAETTIKAKNQYELYILLNPESASGDLSAIENKISEVLQNHSAQIERSEKFSKKDVAYPMKSFNYAYVASIYFFASPEKIDDIQAEFKISEIDFLRLMVTKVQPRKARKAPRRKARPKVNEKDLDKAIEKTEEKAEAAEKTEKTETEDKASEESSKTGKKEDGVTLEEIDQRLDEIMENL